MIVLPRVIGHRGAAADAPENTLAGIRAAAAIGVQWVELDVRLTADGRCVLLHDENLKRTTGVRRRLRATAHSDIVELDAGRWFSESFAGERLPTLEAVLSELAALGMGAVIEIKPDAKRANLMAVSIAEHLVQAERLGVPVLVSSFDEAMLRPLRRLAPDAALGLNMRRLRLGWRDLASELGCYSLHCSRKWLRAKDVGRFRAEGYKVVSYTVNDPETATRHFDWGVQAIISDKPSAVLEAAYGPMPIASS